MKSKGSIGVFDSGVGGLTVVKQISQKLPRESVIYFADEAHVPYGERHPYEIISFALGITRFLIERGAKLIVMGCNMSSALALAPARQLFPDTPVIGVIEAGVRAALRVSRDGKIGVLATTGTVNTHAYRNAILRLNPSAMVVEQACPKFVPLVEAGMADSEEAESAAHEYMKPLLSADCSTIILGCTHYPFLAGAISRVAGEHITLIDPAEETAAEAANLLSGNKLLDFSGDEPSYTFFTTARTEKFADLGSKFLNREIQNLVEVSWGKELGAVEWREKTVEQTTKSAL
ncbi:MAG: glutamate racemase [Armatimonadota bacterium]|nr:glutamate racemase [Armatimonadota bacterium]